MEENRRSEVTGLPGSAEKNISDVDSGRTGIRAGLFLFGEKTRKKPVDMRILC